MSGCCDHFNPSPQRVATLAGLIRERNELRAILRPLLTTPLTIGPDRLEFCVFCRRSGYPAAHADDCPVLRRAHLLGEQEATT